MRFSPVFCYLPPICSNDFLSTLFSNTLSLRRCIHCANSFCLYMKELKNLGTIYTPDWIVEYKIGLSISVWKLGPYIIITSGHYTTCPLGNAGRGRSTARNGMEDTVPPVHEGWRPPLTFVEKLYLRNVCMGFEVLTEEAVRLTCPWDVTPSVLVDLFQRIRN